MNFSYFNVLYTSYRVNKVIDVLNILMYYYIGILLVVLGGFRTQVYLKETCRDKHKRSATNKLTWECCTSYSTSIAVVFGSFKTTGG